VRHVRWCSNTYTIAILALAHLPGPLLAQVEVDATAPLPTEIPLFSLQDVTLFPNSTQPFHIFEPRYRTMVADALAGDSIIGMVMLKPGYEAQYEGRPPVFEVGTAGVIVVSEELPDGRYNIVLRGVAKFRILTEDQSRPYRLAEIEGLSESLAESDRPLLARFRTQIEESLRTAFPGAQPPSEELTDEEFVDGLSLVLPMEPAERQQLLEADGPLQRASALARRLRRGPRSSL
jgi:Lon protease-like protein